MGPMRLVLIQQGDSCFGYVYEQSIGSCTAHFEGRFDANKKELKGSSPSFIEKDFAHVLARYSLKYDSSGQRETLSGRAKPKTTVAQILNFGMSFRCTLYRLKTVPDTTDFMVARINKRQPGSTIEVPLQDQSMLPDTSIAKIQPRQTETLHIINAAEGLVKCTLYDNGIYDHDTVTVLYNNNIIINKAEVSSKSLVFQISLSKQEPSHEIIFYANNLGEIPPNTGVLLIETGGKRFSLPLKADLNTNGKVVIKLTD